MMGYCANGYRLWNLKRNCTVAGCNVIFNENRFEFDSTTYSEDWLLGKEILTDQDISKNENEEYTVSKTSEQKTENILENKEAEESDQDEISQYKDGTSRSTRKTTKPRYLDDYVVLALNAETYVEDVPEAYEDIEKSEKKIEWMKAVKKELNSLQENNTWTITGRWI